MNIIIAGGAGYVGSLLTYNLIKKGHEISILDNLRFNQKSLERLDYSLENNIELKDVFNISEPILKNTKFNNMR